jgi:hypothetical protein
MKIVLVEWSDAYGHGGGWRPVDDCEPTDLICVTVGFLVKKTKSHVVIAENLYKKQKGINDHFLQMCSEVITIPRGMVKKITILRNQEY